MIICWALLKSIQCRIKQQALRVDPSPQKSFTISAHARLLVVTLHKMEAEDNATAESQTALADDNAGGLEDEDKNSVDLGVAGLPQVDFVGSKNEFETINLDGDGDDEDEEDYDHEICDDKRKKKYRKKKRRNQPLEESSDSSTDDERKSCRRKKETNIDPVNESLLYVKTCTKNRLRLYDRLMYI